MDIDVNLNDLILDNFVDVAIDIIECNVDRAILKGGRASLKSQTISECIITGVMTYKESAVCCVRYGNKIQERLVNTFTSSLEYMGLKGMWRLRKSPYEYVLLDDNGKETDVSIKFTGCDNPDDLKSYKDRSGRGFRYIWFEELTNFDNLKSVNNLIQTFARGVGKHCIICSYNPPMQNSNWVNKEYNNFDGVDILTHNNNYTLTEFEYEVIPGKIEKLRQVIHHSTYLDVIAAGKAHWLGSTFIGQAEQMRVENEKSWRHQYLGEVIGTEANVFWNIKEWDGDKTKLNIVEIFRGYDWGYGGPDPCAYVEFYYDRLNRRLYALNEFSKSKMTIDEVKFEINRLNKYNFPVYADSANPLLNTELRNKGVNILDAIKGPDSVLGGIKWLQNLNGIYLCPYLTPHIHKEFTEYEYEIDKKTEEVTSKLPDKANHTIDATRYAFNLEIKYV